MIVGHREGEGVGQALAHAQALHCGQAVVQGIGIVAVGVHAERAVAARRIGLGHEGHSIMKISIHRRRQHTADSGRIFNNGGRCRAHCGCVVTAVDGHCQGIGACAAAPVGYREGEGIGQAFARAQALHCGQAVIQGIGIVARGIHAECAVQAGCTGLRNKRHNVMQIRVHRGGQHPCDAGRILANGSQSGSHGGRVITAAIDAHGDYCGRRGAVIVGHRNCEGVGQAVRGSQTLHRGQGSVQHIGIVAVGIHAERAVTARRIGQGREADRIMHIHIRGHRQRAVGNGHVIGNTHNCGGQHRRIIAAVDGHRQAAGGRTSVPVGGCECERVSQAFAHAQALHCGQRIIKRVGIVARGVHGECAVAARRIGLGRESHSIMNIRIHGRGQRAADAGRIFNNGGRRSTHCGRVVGAVDGHGQRIGSCCAMIVRHCKGEGVGQALAHAQTLHCGQAVVQGIGIVAVRIHAERAVTARRIGLRREGHSIMNIRIHGRGQRAADVNRVFDNGSRCRTHCGRVVGAVDSHGQCVGGSAAVPVCHRKRESLSQAFAHAQTLHRRQGIIQSIGIVTGSVHAERAVETRGIGLRSEGHCIMDIHIHGRGQHAADAGRILGNGGRCRAHCG